MTTLTIKNLQDTERLSEILANNIEGRFLLMLNGDLAAGKTTFTKYLAKNLGVKSIVNSPTFNIMKKYRSDKGSLYHIDAYRLEGSDEDLGFEEIFYEDNICVVEWGKFIEEFLPEERLIFNITLGEEGRLVEIIANGQSYETIKERIIDLW